MIKKCFWLLLGNSSLALRVTFNKRQPPKLERDYQELVSLTWCSVTSGLFIETKSVRRRCRGFINKIGLPIDYSRIKHREYHRICVLNYGWTFLIPVCACFKYLRCVVFTIAEQALLFDLNCVHIMQWMHTFLRLSYLLWPLLFFFFFFEMSLREKRSRFIANQHFTSYTQLSFRAENQRKSKTCTDSCTCSEKPPKTNSALRFQDLIDEYSNNKKKRIED